MKYRNPVMVLVLSIITIGIYSTIWLVKTKNALNTQGANIPSYWQMFLPFGDWRWYDKFGEGLAKVTRGKIEQGNTFFLLFFFPSYGIYKIQKEINKVVVQQA